VVEAHHPYRRPSAMIVGPEYPELPMPPSCSTAGPSPSLPQPPMRVPFLPLCRAAIAIRQRQSRSPTSLMSPLLNSFNDRVLG
jgi:hypothetical protein